MWRRVLGGLLPVAALAAAAFAFAPAASARDVTITSFDGTKIAAHWFPGKGVSAGKPAPTILAGPGWSQPGDSASGGGPAPDSCSACPASTTSSSTATTSSPEIRGDSGQMSLDFIETDDGLVMIECNPRPTDGVLLMTAEELGRGPLAPDQDVLLVPPGREEQLDFAVCAQIFREPLQEAPKTIHDLARIHGTDRGWRDSMPKLYSFLALCRFERLSLQDREQLFVAMADGITWDGQSIPGLPPDDAAYLAKLTG